MKSPKENFAFPNNYIHFFQILLFILFIPAIALTQCAKEVTYRVLEEKVHSLEDGVDIYTLDAMDLIQGKPAVQYTDVSICIDQSGFITKTSTYKYGTNSFYPNRIHQTIENTQGISDYDTGGTLISNIPNDPQEIAIIPGIGFALSAQEINDFGLSTNLAALIPLFQDSFEQANGTNWNVGNKHFFSADDQDIVISPDDLYFLTSYFDPSGDISTMQLQAFINKNSVIIPQYDINYNYSELSDGSKIQTTYKETYLDYVINQNGNNIFFYASTNHPYYHELPNDQLGENQTSFSSFKLPKRLKPELDVFPNPASDQITINLNELWSGHPGDWSIDASTGQQILRGQKESSQNEIQISLDNLASGIYFFKLNCSGQSIAKKFIISK